MKRLISVLLVVVMLISFAQVVNCEGSQNDMSFDEIKNAIFKDERKLISNEDFYKMSRNMRLFDTNVKWPGGGVWYGFEPAVYEMVFTFEPNIDPTTVDAKELLEQTGINSKYLDIQIWHIEEDEQGNKICGYSISWSSAYYEELDPYNNISSIEDLYLFATVLTATGTYDYDYCGIMRNTNYMRSSTYLCDVNFDGVFNTKDITAMKRCIVSDMDLYNSAALDQNKDGSFNAKDIKVLKSKIANG